MIALHRIPEKYLPFRSTALPTVIVVALLIAAHRAPLRILYQDASNMLKELCDLNAKAPVEATDQGAKVLM